jgi:hypothetical protein
MNIVVNRPLLQTCRQVSVAVPKFPLLWVHFNVYIYLSERIPHQPSSGTHRNLGNTESNCSLYATLSSSSSYCRSPTFAGYGKVLSLNSLSQASGRWLNEMGIRCCQ